MTTSNAYFSVGTYPHGVPSYNSLHDGQQNTVWGIKVADGQPTGTIPWEKGETVMFYAGPEADSSYQQWRTNYSTSIALGDNSEYKQHVVIVMHGVCNGWIQHLDKNGNEFSKKTVHAPNTLSEDMTLQRGEAMILKHSY